MLPGASPKPSCSKWNSSASPGVPWLFVTLSCCNQSPEGESWCLQRGGTVCVFRILVSVIYLKLKCWKYLWGCIRWSPWKSTTGSRGNFSTFMLAVPHQQKHGRAYWQLCIWNMRIWRLHRSSLCDAQAKRALLYKVLIFLSFFILWVCFR